MAERKWRAVNSALFLRTHPRVCGENGGVNLQTIETDGSSPRVRGKPHADYSAAARDRLIPACAGKTAASLPITRSSQAHPRVCGENDATDKFQNTLKGSSPRVRGKLLHDCFNSSIIRLIPACAGKTLRLSLRWGVARAHPRVCGENARSLYPITLSSGSSPRVRGKLSAGRHFAGQVGLIPALAGKTLWAGNMFSGIWAHPRAGGEGDAREVRSVPSGGSSPRWRGKPYLRPIKHASARLIPALAGKTRASGKAN